MWEAYMNYIDFLAKWHMVGYKEMMAYVVIPIMLIIFVTTIIRFIIEIILLFSEK